MDDMDVTGGATEDQRTLPLADKIVIAVCVVGVLAAVAFAFSSSGLGFLDGHMFDVVSATWNNDATIGVLVALATAIFVGAFVLVLSRATIAHREPEDEGE